MNDVIDIVRFECGEWKGLAETIVAAIKQRACKDEFSFAQKIVKNSLYGEQHMKNIILALPDIVKIRDITSDFDTMTLKALIGALIISTADRAGMDPGELAFKMRKQ